MMKKLFMMICFAIMANVYCYGGDELKRESDGFTWTLRTTDEGIRVALDASGKEIMPADRGYLSILYIPATKGESVSIPSVFLVSCLPDTSIMGACNTHGEEVVPVEYKDVSYLDFGKMKYYLVMTTDSLYGVYDEKGRMLVAPRYYNKMPFPDGDRFKITNFSTDELVGSNADYLVTIYVSNSIKDYYSQQKLLTDAIDKQVNTDALLQEAFELENSGNTKKAIDKLSAAIKQKPSSLAYLHRGQCYYQNKDWKKTMEDLHYVFFLDDATPEVQMRADSVLTLAEEALMGKKLKNRFRFLRFYATMEAIANNMDKNAYLLQGSPQLSATPNSPNFPSGMNGGSSSVKAEQGNKQHASGHHTHSRRCSTCGGDGKCRGKYKCHGSGVCSFCNGKKVTSVTGIDIKCATCNGTGKCSFCKGTGECNRCGGRGTL